MEERKTDTDRYIFLIEVPVYLEEKVLRLFNGSNGEFIEKSKINSTFKIKYRIMTQDEAENLRCIFDKEGIESLYGIEKFMIDR